VRDIARVSIGGVPRQGVAGQDDDDDIVYGMVLMRKGRERIGRAQAVKERIEELNRTQLPPGVRSCRSTTAAG
jgi:cobalt-zinc-cadmium resistance protein CzcA